jgi:hypothetical protein
LHVGGVTADSEIPPSNASALTVPRRFERSRQHGGGARVASRTFFSAFSILRTFFAALRVLLNQQAPEKTLSEVKDPEDACEAAFYVGEWYLLQSNNCSATEELAERGSKYTSA